MAPPDKALLFVICSPVGPYYPTGFKPVSLYGTTEYIRAAPGGPFIHFASHSTSKYLLSSGTGAYKLGANYAPGVMPQKAAIKQGYTQNLWLHGPEHYLTEVGHHEEFCYQSMTSWVGWYNEHVRRPENPEWGSVRPLSLCPPLNLITFDRRRTRDPAS